MRNLRLPTALACIGACASGIPATKAGETTQSMVIPAAACQLSIPTTNTGVRPKATGFRNESTTTGNFVICPLAAPTSRGTSFNPFWYGMIILQSLDGASHEVSCTGVAGGGAGPLPKYSTKLIEVPGDTDHVGSDIWQSFDFGQPTGNLIEGSAWFTITCNLPPQTVIKELRASVNYEIGS